eukprot:506318-Prymnesium_polylepis.1
MPLQCADCGQYIICTDPACQHGGRCNGVVCSEGAYCAPCTQYTACDPWEGVKPGAVLTLANRVVSDHTCESESCQRSFDKMYEGVNNSLRAHPDCTMESLVLCKGRCLPCIDNEDFDVEGVACDDFCGPACGNTGVAYGLADEALFWGTCLMSQTCPPIDVSHYTLSTKLDVINAAGTPAPSASELASALSRLFGIAQDDVAAHDDVADQSGQLPSGKYDLAVVSILQMHVQTPKSLHLCTPRAHSPHTRPALDPAARKHVTGCCRLPAEHVCGSDPPLRRRSTTRLKRRWPSTFCTSLMAAPQ